MIKRILKKIVPPGVLKFYSNVIHNEERALKLDVMTNMLSKTIPSPILSSFDVSLTSHCNLNCKGCAHYCPVADQSFIEVDTFANDINRMGELTKGHVDVINLSGGEALLLNRKKSLVA